MSFITFLRGSLCNFCLCSLCTRQKCSLIFLPSLVWYGTHRTESLLSKLFLCSPKSTKTTLAQYWPFCRLLNSENAPSLDAGPFKFVLLRSLGCLQLIIKVIKDSSHLISTEYQIIIMFVLPQTVFHDVLTIFKIELSKSGKLYLEAVHRKLKFKVPSTNIRNKTCWHRSISVCDELLKFYSPWIRLFIECQIWRCYVKLH